MNLVAISKAFSINKKNLFDWEFYVEIRCLMIKNVWNVVLQQQMLVVHRQVTEPKNSVGSSCINWCNGPLNKEDKWFAFNDLIWQCGQQSWIHLMALIFRHNILYDFLRNKALFDDLKSQIFLKFDKFFYPAI